jgi:hypothetical protein
VATVAQLEAFDPSKRISAASLSDRTRRVRLFDDTLDRFLDLQPLVRRGSASAAERREWQVVVQTLVDSEVRARSRRDPTEGRRHIRSTARLIARVKGGDGPAEAVVSVGTGGFTVHTPLPCKRGDLVEVDLPLPETQDYVRALTRVVWRSPGKTGLELVQAPPADQELLASTVIESMLRSW